MAIRIITPDDVVFIIACVAGVNENKQLCVEEKLLINAIKKKFKTNKKEVASALKQTIKIGAIKIKNGVVILIGENK